MNLLIEEVVNLRQHRFGRSSEKGLTSAEAGCSQLCFAFYETEITVDLNPAFPEPELEDIFLPPHKRGKKETGKRLEFHPASFEVIEHHVEVYVSADGGNFAREERPANLFRNSLATTCLVSGIYNLKYVNAQPIERLPKEFERSEVYLPTQTLCR